MNTNREGIHDFDPYWNHNRAKGLKHLDDCISRLGLSDRSKDLHRDWHHGRLRFLICNWRRVWRKQQTKIKEKNGDQTFYKKYGAKKCLLHGKSMQEAMFPDFSTMDFQGRLPLLLEWHSGKLPKQILFTERGFYDQEAPFGHMKPKHTLKYKIPSILMYCTLRNPM